jgi:hypothetical protein
MKPTWIVVAIVVFAVVYYMVKKAVSDPVIEKLARLIQQFEGWFPGSRSQNNNNPGNLKYVGQVGSTGADDAGFAIFPSYAAGYAALKRQLTNTFLGLFGYSPSMSIMQFIDRYSPGEGNENYAEFIADGFGVGTDTPLKDLKA